MASALAYATAVAVTNAVVSLTAIVPPNATEISGTCILSASLAANLGMAICSDTNQTAQQKYVVDKYDGGPGSDSKLFEYSYKHHAASGYNHDS